MRALAKSAGYGLGTDVGDEGAGKGVDLRERAADPNRLGEQDRDQKSGVFLVALVECLLDGIAKLAEPSWRGWRQWRMKFRHMKTVCGRASRNSGRSASSMPTSPKRWLPAWSPIITSSSP